jgi:hypothetical protein
MSETALQMNTRNSQSKRFEVEEDCLQIKKALITGTFRGKIYRIELIKGGVQSSFRVWARVNVNGKTLRLSDFVITLERFKEELRNFDIEPGAIDVSKDLTCALLIGRMIADPIISTSPITVRP